MSAGTAYAKRYASGFHDKPTQDTPIDQQFLNAVETALLQLIGQAATNDGDVMQWDDANTRYGPAKILNKNIAAGAAIAKSKLDFTGANGIVDADVSGTAAIARSKLNFGSGLVNADIAANAAISSSKISGGLTLIDDYTVTGSVLAVYDTNTRLGGNLPTTFKDLILEIDGKCDQASAQFISLRLNNDSSANYYGELIFNNGGASLSASEQMGATSAICGAITRSAGNFSASEITLPNYGGVPATTARGWSFQTSAMHNNTSGSIVRYWGTGVQSIVTAITRIQVLPSAGNFAIGTRFTLYGRG